MVIIKKSSIITFNTTTPISRVYPRSAPVPPARCHPQTAVPLCPACRLPLIRVTYTDQRLVCDSM